MAIFCDTKWVSTDGSLASDITDTSVVPSISARGATGDEHVPDGDTVAPDLCKIPTAPARCWKKSLASALCIIPPESVWDQIQAVRSRYDKEYKRWMPHINILFPFICDDGQNFVEASLEIERALGNMKPFTVHFTKQSLGYFFRKKHCTLWLQPLEEEFAKTHNHQRLSKDAKSSVALPHHRMVLELRGIMESIIPECVDRELAELRGEAEFQPHLSLGQFTAGRVKVVCKEYQKTWVDFSFEVKEVHLVSWVGHRFQIRRSVPLCTRR